MLLSVSMWKWTAEVRPSDEYGSDGIATRLAVQHRPSGIGGRLTIKLR